MKVWKETNVQSTTERMSVRTELIRSKSAPLATPTSLDRLTCVLQAGLQRLAIQAEETDAYGKKRSVDGRVMSNVENLGLLLKNPLYPRVNFWLFNSLTNREIKKESKLLGPRLSTVILRRPNTGTAPGVVYDDDSTVLIISLDSGYSNEYLGYLKAARMGKKPPLLPTIQYSFPVPQNKLQPSTYVKNARGHLLSLIRQATSKETEQADFSYDHEQPFSKIHVFFKIPVTGTDGMNNSGPYIYFGRFKAVKDDNMISYVTGQGRLTDTKNNEITSIKLEPFDGPKPGTTSSEAPNMPSASTKIAETDLDSVTKKLEKPKIKQ